MSNRGAVTCATGGWTGRRGTSFGVQGKIKIKKATRECVLAQREGGRGSRDRHGEIQSFIEVALRGMASEEAGYVLYQDGLSDKCMYWDWTQICEAPWLCDLVHVLTQASLVSLRRQFV